MFFKSNVYSYGFRDILFKLTSVFTDAEWSSISKWAKVSVANQKRFVFENDDDYDDDDDDDDDDMMTNRFCGMVDQRKAYRLISSCDHCQRSSPLRISTIIT